MKYSMAAIVASAAALAAAQEQPPEGPRGGRHGPPGFMGHFAEKFLECPAEGGNATVSLPCPPAGRPDGRRPGGRHPDGPDGSNGRPDSRRPAWDGTVTVFPTGAPEVTVTMGIDCKGCTAVAFAKPTCTNLPRNRRPDEQRTRTRNRMTQSHSSHPTVTASDGATKTVYAKGPPTCNPPGATAAA